MGNLQNRLNYNQQLQAAKTPKRKRVSKRDVGKLKESIEEVPRTEPLPMLDRANRERKKQPVNIRLDVDVVDALKAQGAGWQSRINAALRAHLRLG